jgi:hypothetical protein
MRGGHSTLVAVLTMLGSMAISATDEPPLGEVLERAGRYVQHYGHDSAVVIGDELYAQEAHRGGRTTASRQLRSEMMFVFIEDRKIWFAVRNVLAVKDGGGRWRTISDAKKRLEKALKDTTPGDAARLRALANEGARFNVGPTYRNYNSPTLALDFLDPVMQPRFLFASGGGETVAGEAVLKLQFAEIGRPTVISLNDDRDMPSSGWLWVRATDGAVVRTQLVLTRPPTDRIAGLNASILVDYRRDQKLDMWLPSRMQEEYLVQGSTFDRIDCVASYSNFRRFETFGRVVSPK